MRNWQYYENNIKMHGVDDFTIKKGDIPTCCAEIDCKECKFNDYDCGRERSKFLYQEHKEPIKLTRLEYDLLKFVQKQEAKYICRDKCGLLNLFDKKPCLTLDSWVSAGNSEYFSNFTNKLFQFVKWEDEKYYVIEDVLKNCEVIEDE